VFKARYLFEAHLLEGRSVASFRPRTAFLAAGSRSSWLAIERADRDALALASTSPQIPTFAS
jgi:hypothetical protein